jgi:hypothetical protein
MSDVQTLYKEKFSKGIFEDLLSLVGLFKKKDKKEELELKKELERKARKYLRHFVAYNNEGYRKKLKKRFYSLYKDELREMVKNGVYKNRKEAFEDEIKFKLENEKEEIKELVKKLY